MTRATLSRLALSTLVCWLWSEAAFAQSYPTRPVTITSPFANSSAATLVTRVLADKLSSIWPQRVVVEARPGASGTLAIRSVKNAEPDGYNLVAMGDSHVVINPAIYGNKLPYDPEADFVPVAMIYSAPFFFAVSSNGPYQSVGAVVNAAKANPGNVRFGNPFVGSPPHLGAALLEHKTGTKMTVVPFTEWNQLLLTMVQGDVDWTITSYGSARSFVDGKSVKLIAVAANERFAGMPDIPTVAENGGPTDFEVKTWYALYARRGTPPDILQKLSADVAAQLKQPEVIKAIRDLGFEVATEANESVLNIMRAVAKNYGEILPKMGLRPE
jgi:tripartite-type tricarboxylate transporter receptor subunit TctC